MIKKIIGGTIALVIGGTTFAVSQSNVVDNFSKNAGVSQKQAQQYVNNLSKSDLVSFAKVGESYVHDGKLIVQQIASINCIKYTYKWVSPSLSCTSGKNQLQSIGRDEITLGNCFQALDTNLGSSAKSKINECISDIDAVDYDYKMPIAVKLLDSQTITDNKNTNAYNKSVLQAALQAK